MRGGGRVISPYMVHNSKLNSNSNSCSIQAVILIILKSGDSKLKFHSDCGFCSISSLRESVLCYRDFWIINGTRLEIIVRTSSEALLYAL